MWATKFGTYDPCFFDDTANSSRSAAGAVISFGLVSDKKVSHLVVYVTLIDELNRWAVCVCAAAGYSVLFVTSGLVYIYPVLLLATMVLASSMQKRVFYDP